MSEGIYYYWQADLRAVWAPGVYVGWASADPGIEPCQGFWTRVSGSSSLQIEHVESEGIGNRCNLRNPSGLQWLLPPWMLKAVGWRVKEGRAAYHD